MILERDTPEGRRFEIYMSPTPSPRARRFIMENPVRIGPRLDFDGGSAPDEIGPLIPALLERPHIVHVSIEANALTIMQDGQTDWEELGEEIGDLIARHVDKHQPAFEPYGSDTSEGTICAVARGPEIDRIIAVLEPTIMPYIHSHGGNLVILGYEAEEHLLRVAYDGTCESCPSAGGDTLYAVQSLLREEFDPRLTVSIG